MSVSTTIFNRLTRENEDATSELLVNLLKIKCFRTTTLPFLLDESFTRDEIHDLLNEITENSISTQVCKETQGRPDIVINTASFYIFIENKIHINTEIQKTQYTSYPNTINEENEKSKGKKSRLIFLIPRNYNEKHKKHILDLIEVLNNKTVFIIYWEDLITFLFDQKFQDISPLMKDSLEYFNSVIDMPVKVDIKLSSYEVALMYNLRDLNGAISLLGKMKSLIDGEKKSFMGLEESLLKDLNGYVKKYKVSFWGSDYFRNKEMPEGKYIGCSRLQHTEPAFYFYYGFCLTLLDDNNIYIIPEKDNESRENIINASLFSLAVQSAAIKDTEKFSDKYIEDNEHYFYIPLNLENLTKSDSIKKAIDPIKNEILDIFEKEILPNLDLEKLKK